MKFVSCLSHLRAYLHQDKVYGGHLKPCSQPHLPDAEMLVTEAVRQCWGQEG